MITVLTNKFIANSNLGLELDLSEADFDTVSSNPSYDLKVSVTKYDGTDILFAQVFSFDDIDINKTQFVNCGPLPFGEMEVSIYVMEGSNMSDIVELNLENEFPSEFNASIKQIISDILIRNGIRIYVNQFQEPAIFDDNSNSVSDIYDLFFGLSEITKSTYIASNMVQETHRFSLIIVSYGNNYEEIANTTTKLYEKISGILHSKLEKELTSLGARELDISDLDLQQEEETNNNFLTVTGNFDVSLDVVKIIKDYI